MAFDLVTSNPFAIAPNPAKPKPTFPVDILPPVPLPTLPVDPGPKKRVFTQTVPDSTKALMAQLESLLAAKQAKQTPAAPTAAQPPLGGAPTAAPVVPSLSSLFAHQESPAAPTLDLSSLSGFLESARTKPFLPGEPEPRPSPGAPAPVVNRIPEAQFVQLYRDWLGRDPAPGDYDRYGNNSFDAVKAMVVNSDEHVGRWNAQVNAWFNEFKGRDGTPAEIAALRGKYLENIQAARAEIKGATPPVVPPVVPPGGFNANWWAQLTNGKPPTPASLIAMEAELNKLGIKVLRNSEGVAGKIQLPDGRIIDVIISAGLGGRGWQWDDSVGTTPPTIPPPPGTPSVPLQTVPAQFNDPYTKQLEDFLRFRIEELFQPVDDPFRDQYATLLQQRTDDLGKSTADLDRVMAQLREQAAGTNPDLDSALALLRQQVARGQQKPEDNPEFMKLMNWINTRFEDLSHPGYTGAEQEILRTQALDPIERDRAAAQQRGLERISSRGMTPDSGLAQELQAMIDQGFDAERGTAQTTLAANELTRRNDLLNQATGYAQQAYQLPEDFRQGRISDAITAGLSAADLTNARRQSQIAAGTTITDISDARQREALDTANALFGISKGVRDETQNRRQEALSLIGMLADLPVQALKTALMVLGTGEQPGDIMSSLLSIAGLNQRQGQINTQNSSGFWAGLGTLARLLQTSGTGSGTWAETRGTQTTYVPK